MEYSVELKRLIELEMEGSVGQFVEMVPTVARKHSGFWSLDNIDDLFSY